MRHLLKKNNNPLSGGWFYLLAYPLWSGLFHG